MPIPMPLLANRLMSVSIVAALVVVLGVLVVHVSGVLGGTDGVTTPKPSSNSVLLEAAARIAEESRGTEQPRVVEAAPLPPLGDADARTVKPQGTSTRPDGLSIVGFLGEMAKAPIVDRRGGDGPAGDQPDWLDSPTSVGNLAAQAASTGRGWSFGWIRLADDARRPDVATSLENAGAEIVGSAGRLLRVRLPGDEGRLAAIAALPAVDGLGAMPPQAKLRAFDDPSTELPDEGPVPVFVTLMAEDADGRWGRELAAGGAVVGRYDPAVRVYAATVARDKLTVLASADFVLAVEPIGIVEPAHDTAVPAMGADAVRVHGGSPGIFTGTGGKSVPIGVMDSGLNVNHPDIAEHRDSICGVNLFWLDPSRNDQDLWVDADGHGTHVTGTIAGNGFLAPRFAGMAPSVRHIRFAKVFHHDQEVLSAAHTDTINRAMDFLAEESGCAGSVAVRPLIVNMSLSGSSSHFVGRDVNARKLDATVWRHRQLYVVAQSNEGAEGFSNYAAAKNSLSVGAVSDDGAVAAFSSHGPTADGRLAPQVVGTGVGVCSTEGNGKGAGYICYQGTSTAAPSVAGVAALLMDANADYGSQPALARARLMASAVRPDAWLEDETVLPTTNSDGPGHLQAMYGMGRVSARLAVVDRDRADGWKGGGAIAEVADESEYAYADIVVPEGASRLDVVMTWDEPPTEAIASPVLNDLDLWLDRDADCADGPCGEQSSMSRIDNVEWIVVRNPPPGTYRAKVVPRRIYTAPPKAAVSWTVIRGASTPSLAMAVEETSSEERGDERRLEVAVEITADAYVAAGVRLHVECRGGDSDCGELAVAGSTIGREDGVTRDASRVVGQRRNERRRPIGMATKMALGEVAVGESQSVTLDVVYSGDGPLHLYLTASAWNGRGVSQAVLIDPPGADPDSDPDPVEAPANDDFANAHRLSTGEGSVPVDLLRAAPEPGEPELHAGYGRPLGSVWYEWTAPSTDLVRFGVAPASRTSMDAYLDVYRGDRLTALDHIVSNRSRELIRYTLLGGVRYPVYRTIFTDAVLFAEEGETYRVRIAHGEPSAPLVMRWRQGPRPENDDFPDAVVLSGPEGGIVGTNLGATLESGESFGPLAATTWYRWTAPEDGSWRFRIDTDHLLRVAAFTGDGTDDLRLVSGLPSSTVYFAARGGAEYRIAVASRDAVVSGGSYDLSWAKAQWTPDAGDRFAQAGGLGSRTNQGFAVSLTGQTVEPGEPEESGVRTRWWSWTAPETGRFTWVLVSPWTELSVAVFAGDSLENLELAASTGPDVTSRELSFPATEGERYWISVGWPAGDYGAYTSSVATGSLWVDLTPENDEFEGAIALGSTRGLTVASNEYATTAAGELVDQLGHSTLWWTYEAPTPGWYEFHTTGTQPALVVFEVDATGSLREVSRNRDGRVVFLAEAGKQYAIRASTLDATYGGSLGLYWRPVDPPAWLRYMGSFADAEDSQGDAVQLIDAGSLAVDAEGRTLYAVSAAGLSVFERDADTGALTDGTSLDEDLSGSVLLLDAARERLIANRCGTWRVYTGLDDADGIEGADLTVEGDPANCGRRLFLEPEGAFLYRVAPGHGIDVIAVEDGGLRHLETTQLAGIRDAVMAPRGDFVYAARLGPCNTRNCRLDSTTQLRTFRRDRESGLLALQDRKLVFSYADDFDSMSIADDERLFVTQNSTGYTLMYELASGRWTPPGTSVSLFPDVSVQLARPFEFASARSGTAAVDVFGTDVAVGFEILQREVDLLANGQPDRFGNRVPLFGAPNGLATSPDGRHLYLASYQHGIVAFERVGAGVEPEDPHVRLDILEVSSGTISFAAEMDSDGCVAVDDLAHDGATYTVRSSKWQWRPNADWAWTDVAGTARTGELCPHTPAEPGHYRLVVEMDVDGATAQHDSNVLVEDDHGDSIDDATTVGLPSVTGGWLDPDDEDYFRIELEVAGQLTVHSEGWIDAEGRLLDEDGDFIASASGGAADFNFRIVRDMVAGTHFVRVHERLSRAGAYTLHVDFEAHMSDLVVEAVSVSDASPDPGASFTLNATVRNDGKADSTATTLRYFRSTDGSISTDDEEVGTDEVGAVAAAQKSEHSVDLTAPDEPGTYYYGACVDAVDDESDTTNNCSGAAVGQGWFDLDAANGDAVGIAYADGTLYVVDGDAGRVYGYGTDGSREASADFELVSANDRPDGMTHAEGKLHVNDSRDTVYAYQTDGSRVPSADFDLGSNNNWNWGITYAQNRFYVVDRIDHKVYAYQTDGSRDGASDFDLDQANRPPYAIAYAEGTFYVVAFDKVYAYGTDGNRDASSDFNLHADTGSPDGITYAEGSFYVADNSKVFVYSVDVRADAPDLVVESPAVDDATPDQGGSIMFSATVRNQGDAQSDATTLRYYRSSNSTISSDDTEVGTDPVASLEAGGTSNESISLTVPSDAGTYYYGACVDAVAGESDTANNCSTGVQVDVGGGGGTAPDLVVESPSVDDDTPDTGATITLSATVRNRGDGASGTTTLRYYRSSNATISTSDTEVGTDFVAGLAAGASGGESISLTVPSDAGTYYYGACVDSVSDESSTTNNCSGSVEVEVSDGGGGTDTYCRDDDVIEPGERCDLHGTTFYFEVESSGRGCLRAGGVISCSGNSVSIRNWSINGIRVTLVASRNDDDSWTIDDVDPEP